MSTIQAFRLDGGKVKVINFELDHGWIHQIRERIPEERRLEEE